MRMWLTLWEATTFFIPTAAAAAAAVQAVTLREATHFSMHTDTASLA